MFRLVLGALVVVLSLGACSSGSTTLPEVSEAPRNTASAIPTDAGEPSGPIYRATGLDLCADAVLDPLDDLQLTVRSSDPMPPAGAPGSGCEFVLRAIGGGEARLQVEAVTPATVEDARSAFRAFSDVGSMTNDGPVSGLGEEAVGLTKTSQYMIVARTGNLVLTAWLAIDGMPETTLAAKVRTILAAIMAAVPKA